VGVCGDKGGIKTYESGESQVIRASESRQEGVMKGPSTSAGILEVRDGKDGDAWAVLAAKELPGWNVVPG
jgi:hypothetical protein